MSVLSQFTGFPLFDGDKGNITVSASGQTWTIDNGVVTNTMLANSTISGVALGSNLNSITFNNGGSGGASGSTFNGGSALTVSYNTVGAPSTTGTNASGTWGISVSGSAATLTTGRTIALTGDVTGTSAAFNGSANLSFATTLANSGVSAATYGSSSTIPQIAVDAKGRITSASSVTPVLTLENLPDAAFKRSVRCATTANITLSGVQTIDTIAVVAGDRVLVKNQTTTSQNGIYVVAAGAWTRALDADASSEIGGAVVNVDSGGQGGQLWTTSFRTTDTIGTTAMLWYKIVTADSGSYAINITGSAASATSATSASTATTATNATNVALTTSATASAFKVPFANTTASTTGNYGLLQDSEATFTYNPSTNTLTAGTFSGALSGNATTASTASSATVAESVGVSPVGTNLNYKVPFTTTTGNAFLYSGLYMDDAATFTYNPSTNTLTAGIFSGSLSGNATSATTATTATSATNSENVLLTPLATAAEYKVPFSSTTLNGALYAALYMDDTATFTYNPSTNTLTVANLSSTGSITSAGNITAYSSDGRLKENLKHLESPLAKVQSLNGYTFDWNETSKTLGFTPKHEQGDIGLIAQEVQAVLPQAIAPAPFDHVREGDGWVSKSGENYLTIQYERLVPLLVEAIKEQQGQIEDLKKQIEGLKN